MRKLSRMLCSCTRAVGIRVASEHFGTLRASPMASQPSYLRARRTRTCGAPARGCSDAPRRAPVRSYSKSSSRYAGLNLEAGGGSHESPEVALLPTIDRKATQKRLACEVAARGYVSRRGGTAGRGAHRGGEGDAVSLRDEREVCEVDERPHAVRGHDRREPAAAERAADASDAASAEERVRRQIHEDDRRAP